MASLDPFRRISQLTAYSREDPNGGKIWSCATNAINATVIVRGRDIEADLSDTDAYLTFLKGAP